MNDSFRRTILYGRGSVHTPLEAILVGFKPSPVFVTLPDTRRSGRQSTH